MHTGNDNEKQIERLSLRDPEDFTNDVSRSSRQIRNVLDTFSILFKQLTDAAYDVASENFSAVIKQGGILAAGLKVDTELVEKRKALNQLYYSEKIQLLLKKYKICNAPSNKKIRVS